MFNNLAPVVAIALIALRATAEQAPLCVSKSGLNGYDTLSAILESGGESATDTLATLIRDLLSTKQREDLLLKLLAKHDVIDAMHLTGHGDGLDEERTIIIFGEEKPIMCVMTFSILNLCSLAC